MAMYRLPPRGLVRQLLFYAPETGEFMWRYRDRSLFPDYRSYQLWNGLYPGRRAGTLRGKGRLVIGIKGRQYFAHRLAWLYVRGEPVPGIIDHADRDPLNNRIENLRAASLEQNRANSVARKDNGTGVKGVGERPGGFSATIQRGGMRYWLGTFGTVDEARSARHAAAVKFDGEYARTDPGPDRVGR
jgi:hypothetical protein